MSLTKEQKALKKQASALDHRFSQVVINEVRKYRILWDKYSHAHPEDKIYERNDWDSGTQIVLEAGLDKSLYKKICWDAVAQKVLDEGFDKSRKFYPFDILRSHSQF